MIKFAINKKEMEFLVDTGSLVSIISVQMMEKLRMNIEGKSKISLMSASGTPLRTKGFVNLKMMVGKDVSITHKFLVLEGIATDAIIGADFLKQHDLKVDFQNQSMSFELNKKKVEMAIHISEHNKPEEVMHIPPGESKQFFMDFDDFQNYRKMTLADGLSVNMFTSIEKNPVSTGSAVCVITNVSDDKIEFKASAPIGYSEEDTQDPSLPPHNEIKPTLVPKSSCLNAEQEKKIDQLVEEYSTLFPDASQPLGSTNRVEHKIELLDPTPIRQQPYRVGPFKRKEIESQVQDLLRKGIIRESKSEYSSPIVLVTKPGGGWRMCVDYRKINTASKKFAYPIPNTSDILAALHGVKFFSTMDLMSGFHQVKMEESSIPLTAFTCHLGLFEYVRMPFGLQGASSTFEKLLEDVLQKVRGRCVLVFIDDIVIFSQTFEEHLEHLREVFKLLKEAGLTAKRSKCNFGKDSLKFLGHIVCREGILPSPTNLLSLKNK
eukprot:TCONS_00023902-protein